MRHAVGVLGQGGQRFTLARGSGDAGVVQAGSGGNLPEPFLAGFGQFALAQQHRQCPAQGIAQAVLVILRGPQAQLEQGRGQRRHGVEQGNGRFELVSWHFAVIDHFDQNADHLPSPERHPQTHAGL